MDVQHRGERKHNKEMGNESEHTMLGEIGNNQEKDVLKKINVVERRKGYKEQ